jgi:hypothetical protein
MGRVDPTTGAYDATWTPTFNGGIYCISGATRLYVSGAFSLVNGTVYSGVCAFDGGVLSGWDVRTSDTPTANRLANHTGGQPITVIDVVQPLGGGLVGFAAGSLRATRNSPSGYWCGSWGIASDSTGIIVQSGEGFPGINLQFIGPQSLQPTGFTFLYGTDFGGTAVNTLPLSVDTGKDLYTVVSITSGGVCSPKAQIPFPSGNTYGLYDMGSAMLVSGDYAALTGYPTQRNLIRYNPSSGAIDTGFTFRGRLNAAASGSNQPVLGVKGLPGNACVAYGSFGNVAGDSRYDGAVFQGVLILNTLTGARL